MFIRAEKKISRYSDHEGEDKDEGERNKLSCYEERMHGSLSQPDLPVPMTCCYGQQLFGDLTSKSSFQCRTLTVLSKRQLFWLCQKRMFSETSLELS